MRDPSGVALKEMFRARGISCARCAVGGKKGEKEEEEETRGPGGLRCVRIV